MVDAGRALERVGDQGPRAISGAVLRAGLWWAHLCLLQAAGPVLGLGQVCAISLSC